MPFNKEQQAAIQAGIDEDILISAGAGSGKTKTLSERVYHIISDPSIGLKPSELLVLTFTNNAAHEMKGRIIQRFLREGEAGKELARQMQSAHIQTFDSFNQWLVGRYASALGISSNLSIADEALLGVKEREILNGLLEEYYSNPAYKDRLAEILYRLDWKNDNALVGGILRIYHQVNGMIPSKKRDFLSGYEERYLSGEFLESAYWEYVQAIQEKLSGILRKAAAYSLVKTDGVNPDELLSRPTFFTQDIHSLSFSDRDYAEKQKEAILELIDAKDVDTFFALVKDFGKKYGALFPRVPSRKGMEKEEKERVNAAFKILKEVYGSKSSILYSVERFPSLEEAKARQEEDKPLYLLLLDILRKFDARMNDTKRSTNTFTFSDISSFALSLLTLPEYEDIAEEVRTRFRYIMIDEYQDTNDAQEVFLSSLLKENKKGYRSHLFCVGDAKQAIYAFRNSNVELFRKRQSAYLDGNGHRVIAMNKNYRSGKGLLRDLNYIFSHYMSLEHGSIDYDSELERLQYDEEVNLYSEDYPHFGVERIVPTLPAKDPISSEAIAIYNDIRHKVATKYLVYDRDSSPNIRPCRYGDFVILMRTKNEFSSYQELFSDLGVPVSNQMSSNLHEIDAIMLIESLLSLISYFLGGKSNDPLHYFASIARSYAFDYSDESIYRLLNKEDGDPLEKLEKDPTWVQIREFAKEHQNASFSAMFLEMIQRFHVLSDLYRVGQVNDFISKIESLYVSVVQEEALGENIDSFLELLRSMNKYELPFDSKSIIQREDAVELMTIHASKGLQQKIVYMPCSQNRFMKGSPSKGRLLFTEKYGMVLPESCGDLSGDSEETIPVMGIPGILSNGKEGKKAEIDEHVRLFYVALTRAENTVVLVGDPFCKFVEGPFDMLSSCPHAWSLDHEFMNRAAKKGLLTEEEIQEVEDSIHALMEEKRVPFDLSSLSKDSLLVYHELWDEFLQKPLEERNQEAVISVMVRMTRAYLGMVASCEISAKAGDPKALTDLSNLALTFWNSMIPVPKTEGFLGLKEALKDYFEGPIGEGEDSDEVEDVTLSGPLTAFRGANPNDDASVKTKLFSFAEALLDVSLKKAKESIEEIWKRKAIECLPFLSEHFDHFPFQRRMTYRTEGFEDRVSYSINGVDTRGMEPPSDAYVYPPRVNDAKIEFPVRLNLRASKKVVVEEDRSQSEILSRGVYLHRLMELVDFHTMDTSFIPDPQDREIIDKVLSLQVMQNAKEARTYPEFAYYDPLLGTSGYIDLLYEKDEKYVIVDYKSYHVDDPAYVEQLHAYRRNVSRIFSVMESDISLYLLSIQGGFLKKVA